MQAIQHYGIIISWFQDKQLGVVRDKDDTTARLLLLAADLPAGYREPKVGDEITYIAGMDDQNRPCALSPAPVGMQAAEPFAESGATVKEGDASKSVLGTSRKMVVSACWPASRPSRCSPWASTSTNFTCRKKATY